LDIYGLYYVRNNEWLLSVTNILKAINIQEVSKWLFMIAIPIPIIFRFR
jgi:hypothetical protein